MKIYRNQLVVRILGTLMGLGFLAMSAFAFFGGQDLDAYTQDRAYGFALAAFVGGVWAIGVSWLDSDLGGVWCKPPRPLARFKRR